MTVAVIGHGRSPEGKGWGDRINGCEAVIRMWDWTWQPRADYGSKYDYGLFVLTPRGLNTFVEHNLVVPGREWLAYMGKPTEGTLPGTAPVRLVDPTPWVEMGVAMGGAGLSGKLTLTRGAVAAAWAIAYAGRTSLLDFPREDVVLVGFDNVRCGINQSVEKSFCPDYWALTVSRFAPGKMDKVYPIGGPKTATHDMAIELPLLQRLAREFTVRLQFAEDVWKD